jgi:hypothetical protein
MGDRFGVQTLTSGLTDNCGRLILRLLATVFDPSASELSRLAPVVWTLGCSVLVGRQGGGGAITDLNLHADELRFRAALITSDQDRPVVLNLSLH